MKNKNSTLALIKQAFIFLKACFIKSKNLAEYHFFTAKQLADKYHITADSPAIFMLDGRVITDTSQFEIDSSFIGKIEITTNVNYAMPSGIKLLDLRFLKILSWDYLAELESKKKKKRSRRPLINWKEKLLRAVKNPNKINYPVFR